MLVVNFTFSLTDNEFVTPLCSILPIFFDQLFYPFPFAKKLQTKIEKTPLYEKGVRKKIPYPPPPSCD